jgi:cytoskeletal protein RodZ
MALSMDEQRILDEIERGLASADPALATRMSSFSAPRRITTLRMRRLRLVASLMTLVVVAMVSVLVYALVPFRTVADRHGPGSKASSSPAQAVMTAPSHQSRSSAQASATQASAAPASTSPASPVLGTPASAGASASLAPSTHAGASASPAIAHQQARGTPAQ